MASGTKNRCIRSVVTGATLVVLMVVSVSCSFMGRRNAQSQGDESRATAKSAPKPPARVSAEALEAVGLREEWYAPPGRRVDPRDGEVDTVFLLPEGIAIVTTPSGDTQERFLKLVSRNDGTSLWWQPVPGPILNAPIAYRYPADSQEPELLFNVHDTIHCLDLQHGALLWYKSIDPPIASRLQASDSHFFFGGAGGRFYGYKKGAAFADWQYRTAEMISGAPVIANGKVVFGSHDGSVIAVTPERGYVSFQSWRTKATDRIQADLTAYSRWVFAGSADYKLYCLESADGTIYWTFSAGAPILKKPIVYRVGPNKEFVYVIASEGSSARPNNVLHAVPLPKGTVAPAAVSTWAKDGVLEVVSIGQKTVYVVYDSKNGARTIAGLDVATGEERFTLDIGGFDYVLHNSADAGRNSKERGKIYLVSRDGGIQVIGEKR